MEKHWQHFFYSFLRRSGDTVRTPESIFQRRRKYSTTSSPPSQWKATQNFFTAFVFVVRRVSESRPIRNKDFPSFYCVLASPDHEVTLCVRKLGRARAKLRWSSCMVHNNPLSSYFVRETSFFTLAERCHFDWLRLIESSIESALI